MRNLTGLDKGRGWNKGKRQGQTLMCVCGNTFYKFPSGKQTYCSKKCCYENRPKYYKKTINTYRNVAAAELPKQCVQCGTTEKLIVHHKDENRHNNEISNLEYRCHKHHINGADSVHGHSHNRKGIKWSEEMKQLIGQKTREALHKPEVRKKHLEGLNKYDRSGKNNPRYKHGRFVGK